MLSKEQQENILAALHLEFTAEEAREVVMSSQEFRKTLKYVFDSIRIRSSFGLVTEVVTLPVTHTEGIIEMITAILSEMGYYAQYCLTKIEGGDCWCISINWSISRYNEDLKGLSSPFRGEEEED